MAPATYRTGQAPMTYTAPPVYVTAPAATTEMAPATYAAAGPAPVTATFTAPPVYVTGPAITTAAAPAGTVSSVSQPMTYAAAPQGPGPVIATHTAPPVYITAPAATTEAAPAATSSVTMGTPVTAYTSAPQPVPVSEQEVRAAQKAWADAIKGISKTYLEGGDYVAAAGKAAGELYGYGHSKVLFKPTKAKDVQFRPMASQAMSYFVGSKAVGDGISEDGGFAINGGKGWSDVVFDNHQIDLNGNVAIAMGNYYFTSASDGSKTKVEYTFGYKKNEDGKVRIFLHHSSVPFEVQKASVTEAEVQAAQKAWADAIKGISKTYLEGGDYVAAASKAAGELYGYGHSNVLFKPTKAKDVQFRPTASQAMSYFVGSKAVGDGISEDGGFAINGGKGWSDVVFDNHQIDLNGNVAIAMGNYYFTSAADGSKTKVEYTFGYKKNEDGKARIFLHHSSVPFQL